ncbi:putative phospholipase B-like lamina ancestor [Diachasma alloeum]|uniref:putative phospholipase B-like lamina ancestor n=1 Tax=Diachasma alloeum TaxID=454923 RepID=UPI00073843D5|nr:putative phospholipase B-like lamina ancestor [Diachasma alloeum]XP_015110214.1 putative phospholipase B-like lamina ancestor [Diachasma alloeum]
MLKVVGASWLQTRISTYILVAVALMGIGAIVLGEFGRVDNDGTYAAVVTWNPKTGYKIDFWGQGNDLETLPRRTARGYYRTRIQETGWSFVEIETSPNYPDAVQAYAAGLLEGSLTWQLIHHHWHNTIEAPCVGREEVCDKIRKGLKENADATRDRANALAAEDPFWHMVQLFYAQLEGLEQGWRQAVKRSKNSAELAQEDFLWLAMASDISNFGSEDHPTSERNFNVEAGGILVKSVPTEDGNLRGLIGIIHSTAAPYQKMLRLMKKYTFGYHLNSAKNSARVPTRSIVASSYPGALSSQDEYYLLHGEKTEDTMIIAGTPLAPFKPDSKETEGEIIVSEKQESHTVMSSARIMSSNWLSSSALSWGRYLARRRAPEDISRPVQWIITTPRDTSIWIIEQHPSETHAIDYTKIFTNTKSLFCNGKSVFEHKKSIPSSPGVSPSPLEPSTPSEGPEHLRGAEEIEKTGGEIGETNEIGGIKKDISVSQRVNSTLNSKLIKETPGAEWIMGYRGDLEKVAVPFGNIDTKLVLIGSEGIETFQATSGPFSGRFGKAFEWGRDFPGVTHVGQPEKFHFQPVTPSWAWV